MYPFGSQHLKNVTDYMKGLKNWRIRIRIRRTVVNLSSNVYIKNVYKSKRCSFSSVNFEISFLKIKNKEINQEFWRFKNRINIFLDVQPNFYNQMVIHSDICLHLFSFVAIVRFKNFDHIHDFKLSNNKIYVNFS